MSAPKKNFTVEAYKQMFGMPSALDKYTETTFNKTVGGIGDAMVGKKTKKKRLPKGHTPKDLFGRKVRIC